MTWYEAREKGNSSSREQSDHTDLSHFHERENPRANQTTSIREDQAVAPAKLDSSSDKMPELLEGYSEEGLDCLLAAAKKEIESSDDAREEFQKARNLEEYENLIQQEWGKAIFWQSYSEQLLKFEATTQHLQASETFAHAAWSAHQKAKQLEELPSFVIKQSSFEPDTLLRLLAKRKIASLNATPTHLNRELFLPTHNRLLAKLAYPFSTLDKGEARPSSERPRGSEEGHHFKEELASEVNGYHLISVKI